MKNGRKAVTWRKKLKRIEMAAKRENVFTAGIDENAPETPPSSLPLHTLTD